MKLIVPFTGLVSAKLLKRYKRFLADVRLEDGSEVTVHCPTPGRMSSILPEAETVYLTDLRELPGKRKLSYRWELADVGEHLVLVNTQLANRVASVVLADADAREEMGLPRQAMLSSEVSMPGRSSRFDFALTGEDGSQVVIEVKQVSLRAANQGKTRWAAFPDAVTTRGRRHLEELSELARNGTTTMMLYVVGRNDVDALRPAHEVDPDYALAFEEARRAGVLVKACRVEARMEGLYWDGWVPVPSSPE